MPASANFFRPAAATLRNGPRLPRIVAARGELPRGAAYLVMTIDVQWNREP
jgi:hypothetical protein